MDKRTPVADLQPGMVLAEPVFHPATLQMVWNIGTTLTERHLALLRKMDIEGIRTMDLAGAPTLRKPAPDAPAAPPARGAGGLPPLVARGPVQDKAGPASPASPSVRPAGLPRTAGRPPVAPRAIGAPPMAQVRGRADGTPAMPSWMKLPTPLRLPQRIREEVLQRNLSVVKNITQQVRHASRIDIGSVDQAVQTTIRRIVEEPELIQNLVDLRIYDEYTYTHSANVMSLALVVGTAMKYPLEKLRMLGIGALLHDIGKTLVPEEILNKPSKLTEEEFRIMATHPANGIMILGSYQWANNDIKNCAFQHHEKINGKGYPMGLKGDQIAEMSQVVSIVDFYDALISDRCYKKGLPPDLVYQTIINGTGTHFDARIVKAFLKYIVPYPVNAEVVLSNGMHGRVTRVNRKNLLAPVVLVEGHGEVDLMRTANVTVTQLKSAPKPGTGMLNPAVLGR
ncbi:MAG: HD domain-containing phosphohydrolase [Candidatus Sericytochromatia bacterium]|nr:HD domain-containing phosphohydrolase [Candidatus Sericytochromatia bacterium]